ncbi:MAG TPA: outer membrane beta-barrel protein [Chitinophagaceae bacterium]|nr:outer membrane beta-barrel protein [Chitinophagaceae bacterium]
MQFSKIILIVFFSCPVVCFAQQQNNDIKGVILDSISKEIIPFATIRIRNTDSNKQIILISQADGTFSVNSLNATKYLFNFSALGYLEKDVSVDFSIDTAKFLLQKIYIVRRSTTLKNVEVTSKKPLVKREIDRLIYNAQADPESNFQSTLELLRKVPLVTISGDNQIKVRGLSGYQIYLNGRSSSISESNAIEVLKSMPAINIARIEVITTPPANFDGQGFGGIINIVTIKKPSEGYNGRIGLRYNTPSGGPAVNASFNFLQKKFGASLFSSLSQTNNPTTEISFERYSDKAVTQLLQNGNVKSKYKFYFLQLQTSYELDSVTLLTFNAGVNGIKVNNSRNSITDIFSDLGVPSQGYSFAGLLHSVSANFDANVNFERHLKNDKSRFYTVSYNYIHNGENQKDDNVISGVYNYTEKINYYQLNNNGRDEHTLQFDFVLPLKKVKIEIGSKAIFRDNYSDYNYQSDTINIPSNKIGNRFKYLQNVYSIYNSYTYSLKKVKVKTGIRLEYTSINARANSFTNGFLNQYINILPSISIQKVINDKNSITFGYSSRLWRPDITQLNPFVNTKDPNSTTTGSPNLKIATSNNLEIFYNYNGKISIDIGTNYFTSKNNIEIITFYDALKKMTQTTYQNASKKNNLGFSLSINYSITPTVSISTNCNYTKYWIIGTLNKITFNQQGNMFNLFGSISKKFKNNLNLSLNSNYNNGILLLQGQTGGYGTYSVSLSRLFINKKLNISFSCSNFLNKYRNVKNNYVYNNSVQSSTFQRYYRQFTFGVSYRFGKLKKEIRQNSRRIYNDDIKNGK